jgi:ABC-type transport system substrate-binding protein
MRAAGYGPDKPLTVILSTRDVARYRDVSILILDQLSKIGVKGELKTIDTAIWTNTLAKHNYQIAVRSRGQSMDDPDVSFYESYACGSRNNVDGYCNKEIEALIEQQSSTVDPAARKKLVKEIDRRLQMDVVRPTITFAALPYCRRPYVKGYVPSMNSQYSNLRMEDVWLDK